MRAISLTTALLFAVAASASASASAQDIKVKEEKAGLLKKARITSEAATASALAKVPNGKIQSAEIEEEKGKLIYSFDIKVAGKKGTNEVNVDAMTGAVLAVEHEDAKTEAKEKKDDAKAAKPPVKKP